MDGSREQPNRTSATSTLTCASSTQKAARLWRRVCSAHQPRDLKEALFFGAAYAYSYRGRNPLALG